MTWVRSPRFGYWSGLVLGGLLVWGVFHYSSLSLDDLVQSLAELSLVEYGILIFLYGLILWLSSRRWSLIVRRLGGESSFVPGFFFYNIALSQAARLLPLGHVAGFSAKLASLKIDGGTSLGRGLCCGVTEALFNLFAIGCLAVSGIILVVMDGATAVSTTMIVVFVFGACTLFVLRFGLFLRIILAVHGALSRILGRFPRLAAPLEGFREKVGSIVLEPEMVARMLAYTLCFYLLGLVRCFFLVWFMDMDVSAVGFFSLYPVMLVVSLLGMTPSGIGIVELGWAGLLLHLGVPKEEAIGFAVVRRVVDESSLLLLTVAGLGFFKWSGAVLKGKVAKTDEKEEMHETA